MRLFKKKPVDPFAGGVTFTCSAVGSGRDWYVSGSHYYQKEIGKVMKKHGRLNPFYALSKSELLDQHADNQMFYKYFRCPLEEVTLESESKNKHDPNAIRICVDGHTIGYIAAEDTARLREQRLRGQIRNVTCEIYGGPRRGVFGDPAHRIRCKVMSEDGYFGVHLKIYQ